MLVFKKCTYMVFWVKLYYVGLSHFLVEQKMLLFLGVF